MNKFLPLLFILLIGILGSCVPNRKLTYMQNLNDQKEEFVKDTALRFFETQKYQYRLQPDDIISIKFSSITPTEYNFFNVSERDRMQIDPLLSGYIVDAEGYIDLNYVGRVKVGGLTLIEAKNTIKEMANQYLEAPTVYIRLLNFNINILGEVARQGTYTTYNQKFNILEALSLAGGLNDFANRANLKIIRTLNDTTKIAYVNVLDDNLVNSPYYYLEPNDIIVVAALPVKNFKQYQATNIGLFLSVVATTSILILRFWR